MVGKPSYLATVGQARAVIGSDLRECSAQQLARAGHEVVCMKKMTVSAACCVMAFLISDGKAHIDRRIAQMQAEGVRFRPNASSQDISAQKYSLTTMR